MQEGAVAHRAAADEELDAARRGLRQLGAGQEGLDGDAVLLAGGAVQPLAEAGADEGGGAGEAVAIRRHVDHGAAVVAQHHVQRRVGHRQPRHRVGDVARLGGLALDELQARRHVAEQLEHLDGGAGGGADLGDRDDAAVLDDDAGGGEVFGAAGGEGDAADAGDRRERLAAKAHGGEVVKILGRADLGGGVAGKAERGVGRRHAGAIVGDADARLAATVALDGDRRGAGVDGVVGQLLDHRGRPLHHLAGGDLVDHLVGQHRDDASGIAGAVIGPIGGDAGGCGEGRLHEPLAYHEDPTSRAERFSRGALRDRLLHTLPTLFSLIKVGP